MKKKLIIRAVFALKDRSDRQLLRIKNNEQEIERAHSRHTHHVSDHRANDLLPQFTALCKKVESLEEDRKALFPHTHTPLEDKVLALEKKYAREPLDRAILMQHSNKLQILEEANAAYWEKIQAFETKMKEQRSDYHDHIRQLVTENEAAHFQMKQSEDVAREVSNAQAAEILHMKEQINKLRTDYLTLVEKKKPAGRPKKGE